MPLKKYGVLKATVTGHLRDADDDHYQILATAGRTLHRVAVNVKSSAPQSPSTLLFIALGKLPEAFTAGLQGLAPGYKALPARPGGLALDYVRDAWFKPAAMKQVPPDAPGVDNDLKDKLEAAVLKALGQPGALLYAFGERWGPEKDRRDRYFRFLPGNGMHDIHMNQGNGGRYRKDNGVHQDGGLVFQYPDGKWQAFFFAFQSQTFDTDGQGHPRTGTIAKKTAGTAGIQPAGTAPARRAPRGPAASRPG